MKSNSLRLISLLFMVVTLSGCGSSASPSAPVAEGPTVDPNLVFTSGAQTVVAQITLDAASRPVPTAAIPVTPTAETLPTLAPLATVEGGAAQPPAGAAVTPGAVIDPNATLPAAPALPTMTNLSTLAPAASLAPAAPAGTVVAQIPDKLQWVSNIPADKSKIPAGKPFKITWKLQNIGTTTWTNSYSFKFYAGTQLAKAAAYPITKDVKPNTSIDFTVDCVAPATPGEVYSLWVLQRSDGLNVGKFDITLTVQ